MGYIYDVHMVVYKDEWDAFEKEHDSISYKHLWNVDVEDERIYTCDDKNYIYRHFKYKWNSLSPDQEIYENFMKDHAHWLFKEGETVDDLFYDIEDDGDFNFYDLCSVSISVEPASLEDTYDY